MSVIQYPRIDGALRFACCRTNFSNHVWGHFQMELEANDLVMLSEALQLMLIFVMYFLVSGSSLPHASGKH